ncbi:PAS domain-containing protein [Flavobacterium sp. MAH-1]|uniref:PAS domain-containing protein n=1 Tax=Flavobacterium agri TaxID=2743471 RepID=A0A7Y8Y1Q0_9FLAO|nr:LuxR C-terminal-related transcriptional regulator [Flavobacterium agri]NUY80768.1 PAS domain-containing protein [Flavobacterium agri]NYA70792.1 PAS domain-containing protein [Flavobacterium agri]
MGLEFYSEAQKVWNRLTQNGALKDLGFELELHKKILEIFHVGKYYYWLFDITSFRFQFMSPEILSVLGYEADEVDLEFFMSKIHPEDQPIFLNHEETVTDFFRQLPLDKIMKYKVSYDYRVIDSRGKSVRILHQVVVIQHDDNNVLLTLGVHTDISHLKNNNVSKLSFIGLEGEPSFINVEVKKVYKPAKEIFTKREKQIIDLLLKGDQSIDIARKLFISKFTVNTHRKNIHSKTGTKNVLELAMKIINEGLI